MSSVVRPLRVLSIDGGGMRGLYTATFLRKLAEGVQRRRELPRVIDVGRCFDLIVGTSTGGILACALATGIGLDRVSKLYRSYGPRIFPKKLPAQPLKVGFDHFSRKKNLEAGNRALREGLEEVFGEKTIGEVFDERGIALAIPAVELGTTRAWVFKTAHLTTSIRRDDDYTLVDVCLATSAAPIFRSLAVIGRPDRNSESSTCFVDGGLWANNPVLVALTEALQMANSQQPIEVYCAGTCSSKCGQNVLKGQEHWDLLKWRCGAGAAELSISAQEFAFDRMASIIATNLSRDCRVIRLPSQPVASNRLEFLSLDDTRPVAMDALEEQAQSDASFANSWCLDNDDGRRFEATILGERLS